MSKKLFSTLAVAAFALTAFQVQAASHAGAAPMAASGASAPKHMMDKKDGKMMDKKPMEKKEEKK
jgi:membrane protein required for beta-lactamase induction